MVLLTKDLRVRRFTPMAENLLRLLPSDVGRSILDIRPNVEIKDFQKLLHEVIATVIPKDLEVEDNQGKWYSVQIKPYRTNDDRIDGAVLLFTDITKLKTSLIYSEAIESIVAHPLIVLSGELKVKRANMKFYETFKTTREETENRFIYELGTGQWNIPELRRLLEEVLPMHSEFSDYEISRNFPVIGQTTMHLQGRRLFYNDKATETILLAMVPEK